MSTFSFIRLFIFLTLFSLFLFSCSTSPRTITPAFYHWKSTVKLSEAEKNTLDKLQVQKVYTRFFDVDLEGGKAVPIAVLDDSLHDLNNQNYEIVPTIFITNRTFLQLKKNEVKSLATKVSHKILSMYEKGFGGFPKMVQIDCDWSQNSQLDFFFFLEKLKENLPQACQLSATIRLHQIKYFKKTGVPPVSRGTLMFYNMSPVRYTETRNSILDLAEAKKYLYQFEEYPLDLDIALPIFGWGAVFREMKMLHLISPLFEEELIKDDHFVQLAPNQFEVQKSTYLKGEYLYQGDRIRLEKAEQEDLKTAVQLLNKEIRNKEMDLIFYHLDSVSAQKYPYEFLEDLVHDMR